MVQKNGKDGIEMMNKQVTLGQMLASIVTIIVAMFTGWMTLKSDVSTWIANQKNTQDRITRTELDLKDMQAEHDKDREKTDQQYREIMNTLYEIKITVEKNKK